jgi:ribosomal protein L15
MSAHTNPLPCRISLSLSLVGSLSLHRALSHGKGFVKVMGKGALPKQPVIVKAKFFPIKAQKKIQDVGGVCILTC